MSEHGERRRTERRPAAEATESRRRFLGRRPRIVDPALVAEARRIQAGEHNSFGDVSGRTLLFDAQGNKDPKKSYIEVIEPGNGTDVLHYIMRDPQTGEVKTAGPFEVPVTGNRYGRWDGKIAKSDNEDR